MGKSVDERFMAKILVGEIPASCPDLGPCWIWTAAKKVGGRYGLFATVRRKMMSAHRWAYLRVFGVIAPGLVLDHLCRTFLCVNPFHLEPVTQAENIRRGETGKYQVARG